MYSLALRPVRDGSMYGFAPEMCLGWQSGNPRFGAKAEKMARSFLAAAEPRRAAPLRRPGVLPPPSPRGRRRLLGTAGPPPLKTAGSDADERESEYDSASPPSPPATPPAPDTQGHPTPPPAAAAAAALEAVDERTLPWSGNVAGWLGYVPPDRAALTQVGSGGPVPVLSDEILRLHERTCAPPRSATRHARGARGLTVSGMRLRRWMRAIPSQAALDGWSSYRRGCWRSRPTSRS